MKIKKWHVKYKEIIEYTANIEAISREDAKQQMRRLLQENKILKSRTHGQITAEGERRGGRTTYY